MLSQKRENEMLDIEFQAHCWMPKPNFREPVYVAYNSIADGAKFTLAVRTDGTLWAWGQNEYGQLGDSTGANRNKPVKIKSFPREF